MPHSLTPPRYDNDKRGRYSRNGTRRSGYSERDHRSSRRRSYSRSRSNGRRSSSRHRVEHNTSPEKNHSQNTSTQASQSADTMNNSKRNISSSRERSRERERRRRKMQAECIRRAGGFQRLADSEGKEPVRLFWDGFQWVAKTGQSTALQNDPALMNSTRKLRRLYFGNLPLHLGLTESLFQELVWIEMKNRKICNDPNQQPVLCVWFAKDKGNYGFVEFASVEETNRALESLDGMMCMGVSLKVSRPNDYASVTPGIVPGMLAAGAAAAAQLPTGLMSSTGGTNASVTGRVVRFCQMVKETDIEAGESWLDFLDDIKTGCAEHGTVTSAVIITPEKKGDCPYEVGDVFLEYSTPYEAATCIAGMTGRRYLERLVHSVSIEDAVYNQLVKPLV